MRKTKRINGKARGGGGKPVLGGSLITRLPERAMARVSPNRTREERSRGRAL